MRDIGEVGLKICLELLDNVSKSSPHVSNGFYQQHYLNLMQDIFFVITDSGHKSGIHNCMFLSKFKISGFSYQVHILAHLFNIVTTGSLQAPLFNESSYPAGTTNISFLREHVSKILSNAFPHLQIAQIDTFVRGLFDLNQDIETFKAHIRDFLINLKEFSGDNSDLFLEEAQLEAERKKKAEMDAALQIPGLIKPVDIEIADH